MNRIYHTWDKWECYPAGFFEKRPPDGMTPDDCRETYATMLSDIERFNRAMDCVLEEWKYSCEHNLTNEKMNRIAWMGQAALCRSLGIPAAFRGGYTLLSLGEKRLANAAALNKINKWMELVGETRLTTESVKPKTAANLY